MKGLAVLFSISLFLLLGSCNGKSKRAKLYHDKILLLVQGVVDSSLDYGDALRSYEKERALQANSQYGAQVIKVIKEVNSLGQFDEDTVFQKHALEMLAFYKTTIQNEMQPFLSSIKLSSFSEAEQLVADSLYSNMIMMENQYWSRFDWAEKKFIKEYEISDSE